MHLLSEESQIGYSVVLIFSLLSEGGSQAEPGGCVCPLLPSVGQHSPLLKVNECQHLRGMLPKRMILG